MRFNAMAFAMLIGAASVAAASLLAVRSVIIFMLMAFTAVLW